MVTGSTVAPAARASSRVWFTSSSTACTSPGATSATTVVRSRAVGNTVSASRISTPPVSGATAAAISSAASAAASIWISTQALMRAP